MANRHIVSLKPLLRQPVSARGRWRILGLFALCLALTPALTAQAPVFTVSPTALEIGSSHFTAVLSDVMQYATVTASSPTATWTVSAPGPWYSVGMVSRWSVLAGVEDDSGMVDGAASAARFDTLTDLVRFGEFVYVADSVNQRVRRVHSETGAVTTFVSVDYTPRALVAGGDGHLYVWGGPSGVRRYSIATATEVSFPFVPTALSSLTPAQFSVVISADGTAFSPGVAGTGVLLRVSGVTGEQTTFAGRQGSTGFRDGIGSDARFSQRISGLALGSDGRLYVSDGSRIRAIDVSTAEVTTVAGNATSSSLFDGVGTEASVQSERLFAVEPGYLHLHDSHLLRRLNLATRELITVRVYETENFLSLRAIDQQLRAYGITDGPASGKNAVFRATGGIGTGRAFVKARLNTGVERTAQVTIAGQTVTVRQPGITANVNPTTWTVANAGGAHVVTVSTATAVAWTASVDADAASWLTVTGGSGSGNGSFTLVAVPFATVTGASRVGVVTVAGKTITVTQLGATASYGVAPAAWTVSHHGGGQVVAVSASLSDAPWTVTGLPSWMSATRSSGIGSGSVTLTAAANAGATPRSATVTVAGLPVSVTQAENKAEPPGPPSTFVATASGENLQFGWAAPTTGGLPTGYYLEAGVSSGFSALVAALQINSTATSYRFEGAPAGRYFVKLRAFNDHGLGRASNEVELRVGVTGSAPEAPPSLTHTVTGDSLQLVWAAPTTGDPVTGYVLEAGSAPGLTDRASVTLGPEPQFGVNGVPPGQYYVRVKAFNSFGISGPSPETAVLVNTTATAPGAPSGLRSTVSGGTVTLVWDAPTTGGVPTEYVLEAGSTPTGLDIVPGVGTGSQMTTYQAVGVPPGTYYVRVRAKNLQGISPASNTDTVLVGMSDMAASPIHFDAMTPVQTLPAPTDLRGLTQDQAVSLQWRPPDGRTGIIGYEIEVVDQRRPGESFIVATGPEPSASWRNVAPGGYVVRVRAVGAEGPGSASHPLVILVGRPE